MVRTAADYSNVRAGTGLHRLDDLGELAARQGYPVSVDRLGNIALLETFKYGISNIQSDTAGLGETVATSNLYSHYGGFTIELTRVANVNSYAGFVARTMAREQVRNGVEVLFCAYVAEPNLKLYVIQRDGTTFTRFGLRWDAPSYKAYIGGDTEGWTEVGSNLRMLIDYPIIHSMKLVADFESNEYVRAFIDGTELTLVAKDPYTSASVQADNIQLSFFNGLDVAAANSVYVDAAIITTNEP